MRWVAFLRGINVGGRRVTGAQLVAAVSGEPLHDVSSYQASGNLLFGAGAPEPALVEVIEGRLRAALGFHASCLLRREDELVALVDSLPPVTPGTKHEVVFFRDRPTDDVRSAMEAACGPAETIEWRHRTALWTRAGPMSESALARSTSALASPVHTVRTAATVRRIVARSTDHPGRSSSAEFRRSRDRK